MDSLPAELPGKPEKLFISPSILNYNLAYLSILGCKFFFFFPFSALNISCQYLLACKVYAEKSTDRLKAVPLYVTRLFPLDAFKIISLTFNILIVMCLSVRLFRFILFGALCFLDFESVSFARLEEFLAILSSNGFSGNFSLILLGLP